MSTLLHDEAKAIYSRVAAVLCSPRAVLIPADVRELLAAVALHMVYQAARVDGLQLAVDQLTKKDGTE